MVFGWGLKELLDVILGERADMIPLNRYIYLIF
jgi:hypothetical protein